MAINNQGFNNDRKTLKNKLSTYDRNGKYISQVSFKIPLFFEHGDKKYQLIGINSSFISEEVYVEIFITIDLIETLADFNGSTVKVFYFNQATIEDATETSELEIRSRYSRPEWRRLQKYLKKEAPKIVKYNKPPQENTELPPTV